MIHKAIFTISEYPKAYIGYTSGKLWNGWATPSFELEESKLVAEGFNECAEYPIEYDEVYDQFYILDKETMELETWKGIDVQTPEGIKHLYGIGAYSWVWDEESAESVAKGIDDLFWDYDLSVSWQSIAEEFKDFNLFRLATEILRDDSPAEEKIQKLREELKCL